MSKSNPFSKIKIVFGLVFLLSASAFCQQQGSLYIVKNQSIDSLLIKKKAYDLDHPSLGYSIQLYNGNETLSYKIKDNFTKAFAELPTHILFDSPDWKVMVGNFRTRIEADRTLRRIKKQFLGAVVVLSPLSY